MRLKAKKGGPAHTKEVEDPSTGEPRAAHYPWDAALQALNSGAYDVHGEPRDRGPDQPGAQTPAPGVKPVLGDREFEERAAEGDVLTNVSRVSSADQAPLMPKSQMTREQAPRAEAEEAGKG